MVLPIVQCTFAEFSGFAKTNSEAISMAYSVHSTSPLAHMIRRWSSSHAAQAIPRLEIARAADIIERNKGSVLFITGAGVSTESGLPDYRGPTGRYTTTSSKPLTHQEFMGSEHNRKRYWARALLGQKAFKKAQPNRSHFAIADLERRKYLSGLITQNVDRLHHRAGSQNVIELHGRGDMTECMTCGATKAREEYHNDLAEVNVTWMRDMQGKNIILTADGDAFIDESDVHRFHVLNCSECAVGIVKPSFVFFGGSVPKVVAESANELVANSKALFLIGSTSSTYSCYKLIRAAREQGSFVGIVNQGPTRADELALASYADDSCGHFLEVLLRGLIPSAEGEHPLVG